MSSFLWNLGIPKGAFYATTDPTTSDGKSKGFSNGSLWINTVTDTGFLLVDEDTGLWEEITSVPGSIVTSFNGRTGSVVPVSGDYNASQVTNAFDKTSDNSDNITEGAVNLFLTTTERGLIASALQSGDNVSELTNDAGYITASSLPPSFNIDLDSAESSVTRVFAGGRTTFTVTHNLNTLDLKPEVFRLSDGRTVGWRVERTGVNTVEVSRNGNVADGLFRILI
jgi:hypothetical protein